MLPASYQKHFSQSVQSFGPYLMSDESIKLIVMYEKFLP